MPTTLTPTQLAILDIESKWWKYAGTKEQVILDRTGLSATGYYLALNSLIDTEPALAHNPIVVKRLRAHRELRQRSRSARRMALTP